MSIDRLSPQAVQKVSGPAWKPLREAFFQVSGILLSVSSEAAGVLTTIYVKYQTSSVTSSDVYAVAWLKNSKQIVVGLALPDSTTSELLGPAPQGMSYKGITKYFVVKPGDPVPSELSAWASKAFQHVLARQES